MERPRDGRRRSGATPKDEADAEVPVCTDRNESEARAIRDRYGVDDLQVRRDHAISQILAAISAQAPDEVYFIGGTAINRTYVTPGRLSEDIDLIAVNDRATTVNLIKNLVENAVQRSHGRVRWTTDFASSDVVPAVATTGDGTAVKIQMLSRDGYPAWPSEVRTIDQHFPSVAPARLRVPTRPAAIAWKAAAWMDRRASRDLYDLRSLAGHTPYSPEAVDLFVRMGPTGRKPARWMFTQGPLDDWDASLAGQTILDVTFEEALAEVRDAWAMALGEDWSRSSDCEG